MTVDLAGTRDYHVGESPDRRATAHAGKRGYEAMSEKQRSREVGALEKQMLDHARNLEFEKAARACDQLAELKKRVFGIEMPAE